MSRLPFRKEDDGKTVFYWQVEYTQGEGAKVFVEGKVLSKEDVKEVFATILREMA